MQQQPPDFSVGVRVLMELRGPERNQDDCSPLSLFRAGREFDAISEVLSLVSALPLSECAPMKDK